MKLLLVDDEEYTRSGIYSMLPWAGLGISEVRMADDGANGLAEAKVFLPDIIISDVKMPRMDGISMVAAVREFLPQCRVIFMSGYSDREYLKSAIRLSAIRYVDKPIELAELQAAVESCLQVIKEQREEESRSREINRQLETSLPVLKNQIALSLLRRSTVPAAESCLDFALPELDREERYATLLVALYHAEEPGPHSAAAITALRELVEKRLNAEGYSAVAGCKDDALLAVHLCLRRRDGGPLDANGLEALCLRLIAAPGGCRVVAALGQPVHGILNVCDSYASAAVAYQRAFYHRPGDLLTDRGETGNAKGESYVFLQEQLLHFGRLLRAPDREACVGWVRALAEELRCRDLTPVSQTKAFLSCAAALICHAGERAPSPGLHGEEAPGKEFSDLCFLNLMEEALLALLDGYYNELELGAGSSPAADRVTAYVRGHYSDPNLSLASISQEFGLTGSYLCALFKKESGGTLTRYITEYRVRRAEEALRDPARRIKEIALATGFSDYNYFTKVFKKYTGITPLEYRQLSAGEP